jgi:hypothetical protein
MALRVHKDRGMGFSTLIGEIALGALLTVGSAQALSILAPDNLIQGVHVSGTDITVGVAGTTAMLNNWPVAEAPVNAIDGVGQKYLNFAKEGLASS